MKLTNPPGATPIAPEILQDLKQSQITSQAELNAAEQSNIAKSRLWSRTRRHPNLLTEAFVCRLHERMFGDVWKWAGKLRTIDLQNEVFVERWRVPMELNLLVEDTKVAIATTEHEQWDHFAARFHHRLVRIHAFNNGNGRHAREMTDLLLRQNEIAMFSWGSHSLVEPNETRSRYISALRAADTGDLCKLVSFVRS
jgi:Fic-DOC domain mobile mystery protein B